MAIWTPQDGFTFIKTNNTWDLGYLMKEKPIMDHDASMIGLWILLILCLVLVIVNWKKISKKR